MNRNDELKKYEDMLQLPHHVSKKRPQMPIKDRAAQFAPFSAVVGHETAVKEAARLTDEKRELDETEKIVINEKLQEIENQLSSIIEITYFVKDHLKEGGKYITYQGVVKKIDVYNRAIVVDEYVISIDDIYRIIIIQ